MFDCLKLYNKNKQDPVMQLVACQIADPGHTFVEIDHEIFSLVILLLPLIKEGLLSVTSDSICTEYWLTAWSKLAPKKLG